MTAVDESEEDDGICEYCGRIGKLLLDDAGRYACVWCLGTRG